MNKIILLGWSLIIQLGSGFSQTNYFNNLYDVVQEQNGGTAILESNDGYLLIGQTIASTYRGFVLIKINKTGDTSWIRSYGEAPEIFYTGLGTSFIKTNDNNIRKD